ncbi:zinc-binding dehydrogenase, partial [Streptomyces afghaniensis]|uniref:zinc-binding dehydrogenase n=1 Tax=Streptomyces afghaniensis TaxID=66865 RepID=UPI001427E2E0
MAAVIAAGLSGCEVVAAVDVNPAKLQAARGYGATHTVDSSAGEAAEQLAALVPEGFDFVIDTTGREDVLRTAVEALGPLGHAG